MARELERALQYRDKAEEVLVIADGLKSERNKNFLRAVAADYQLMADSLELVAEAGASKAL